MEVFQVRSYSRHFNSETNAARIVNKKFTCRQITITGKILAYFFLGGGIRPRPSLAYEISVNNLLRHYMAN